MTRRELELIALLVLTGAPVMAQAPRCAPRRPAGAAAFEPPAAPSLAGAFVLLTVDTTRGSSAPVRRAYELVLWPNDSSHRLRDRRLGREPGARVLGGTVRIPESAIPAQRTWSPPEGGDFSVVYLAGVLQIGTIDAMDGWRDVFAVHWRADDGFGGRWTSDLGIGMLVDSAGRRLPNPAGYFCAWRVPRFPDAPRPAG